MSLQLGDDEGFINDIDDQEKSAMEKHGRRPQGARHEAAGQEPFAASMQQSRNGSETGKARKGKYEPSE